MRLSEFVNLHEDGGATTGATCSGSIAPVSLGMSGMIRRNGENFFSGAKYTGDDATPNTPAEYKQYKRKK